MSEAWTDPTGATLVVRGAARGPSPLTTPTPIWVWVMGYGGIWGTYYTATNPFTTNQCEVYHGSGLRLPPTKCVFISSYQSVYQLPLQRLPDCGGDPGRQ